MLLRLIFMNYSEIIGGRRGVKKNPTCFEKAAVAEIDISPPNPSLHPLWFLSHLLFEMVLLFSALLLPLMFSPSCTETLAYTYS